MSTLKITRAVQNLLKQISQMARTLTKGMVSWLLRGLLIIGRKPIASRAGFVLPTTVLLLLVVTLTVGAIGFRTYTRSQQAIGERQQRVVYNAATPAIDRAKAKLEFMFNGSREVRLSVVPKDTELMSVMRNDGVDASYFSADNPSLDPYTFPKETRIDINKDGTLDNAWMYETEPDASGKTNRIVYSILFKRPPDDSILRDSTKTAVQTRANQLLIRNAPLSNNTQSDPKCVRDTENENGSLTSEDDWFEDQSDTTTIRKNFQVDAYVLPLGSDGNSDPKSTIATLEFQQDREATQGFRWAAWFRNDLEIFPGPSFNWNGAMHTEGSYFITNGTGFNAYMVSDPDSCLYKENASSITTPTVKADANKGQPDFEGQFIVGELRGNKFGGSNRVDVWDGEKRPPITPNPDFNTNTDSVNPGSLKPVDYALDPVLLHTKDVSATRGAPSARPASWSASGNKFAKRMENKEVKKPYLDDTFRADDRYGPKPTLDESGNPLSVDIGTQIVGNNKLTDPEEGLDGYWERRARAEGLRVIVGQRLELGDPAGWGGPGDGNSEDVAELKNEPLRPWTGDCTGNRCNEARQRVTLWDNLAAVQATTIYHKALGDTQLDYPAACLATTVHPGTAGTLDKSATFENLAFGFKDAFASPYKDGDGRIISDFFRGRGTNGWEYTMPSEGMLSSPSSALRKAMKNLAYFAGDPKGGAPSFTPVQSSGSTGAFPHPLPSMAMWGDFSMLRRILDGPTSYSSLSFADKTTVHTAGCMLSMLAYNLDYLNKFNPDSATIEGIIGKKNATPPATAITLSSSDPYWQGLRGHIRAIDALIYDENAVATEGVAGKVPLDLWLTPTSSILIPSEIKKIKDADMEAMAWIRGTSGSQGSNDPETYVRLLEFWRDRAKADSAFQEQLTKEIALARMIITREQVGRDRRFGFAGRYVTSGDPLLLSKQCETWYTSAITTPPPAGKPADFYVGSSFKEYAKKEPLMRLCSDRPRYPILFSLFPLQEHGDVGDTTVVPDTGGQKVKFLVRDKGDNGSLPGDSVPNFKYISGATATGGEVNKTVNYQVLSDTEIENIAAKPKELEKLGFGGEWRVPKQKLDGVGAAAGGNADETDSGDSDNNGSTTDRTTPNGFNKTASVGTETTIEKRYDLIKICPPGGTWEQIACSRAQDITTDKLSKLKPAKGSRYRVAFKDSALMNGRELMNVRALNLDLDLMRIRKTPFGSDYWLPKSGIIYAFREDAVSEAHIVRPAVQTWANCDNVNKLLNTAGCRMDTAKLSALQSKDPPVNERNISPKPVDFYADPDRRPYGFRLRNGAALWRGSATGSNIADDAFPKNRGLSFITHNPVYVQGYFNLHRGPDKGLKRLDGWEEFEEKVNTADFNSNGTQDGKTVYGFYNRTNLEDNFAAPKKDQWRPAEVLGDSVTLLSPFFCDGSIEDGLITAAFSNGTDNQDVAYGMRNDELNKLAGVTDSGYSFVDDRYGCRDTGIKTSYLDQSRPTAAVNTSNANGVKWMRSSIVDSYWRANLGTLLPTDKPPTGRAESPIFVLRNGNPMVAKPMVQYNDANSGSSNDYAAMKPKNSPLNDTRDTIVVPDKKDIQMNMILISGIVPSRANQAYGGLHNFPRFLESWNTKTPAVTVPLYFSGAFLQLNFSTYATAPFDQEQWEPGLAAPTDTNEWIAYYGPPARRWGFDVGLKYMPPGPVAERFRSSEPNRSEFYDEPPADDPYIKLLGECAKTPGSCGA